MGWMLEEYVRQQRLLKTVKAWADPKKDRNKTTEQILLREAKRGIVEGEEMLTWLDTMMPI
jgi:hypothetical protein